MSLSTVCRMCTRDMNDPRQCMCGEKFCSAGCLEMGHGCSRRLTFPSHDRLAELLTAWMQQYVDEWEGAIVDVHIREQGEGKMAYDFQLTPERVQHVRDDLVLAKVVLDFAPGKRFCMGFKIND